MVDMMLEVAKYLLGALGGGLYMSKAHSHVKAAIAWLNAKFNP